MTVVDISVFYIYKQNQTLGVLETPKVLIATDFHPIALSHPRGIY